MINLLAFIPFVSPLTFLQPWWYVLIVPLAFGISVTYKAIRMPRLDHYWPQVWLMTGQIILVMILIAIALMIFVQFIIPII